MACARASAPSLVLQAQAVERIVSHVTLVQAVQQGTDGIFESRSQEDFGGSD
jgi:hypothetical protein